MATIQNNIPAQNQQDFIRIQDLFYLCLGKWHWFVISLTACLGIAAHHAPGLYPYGLHTCQGRFQGQIHLRRDGKLRRFRHVHIEYQREQ